MEFAEGVRKMTWLWTWAGTCFGYRRNDSLFTHDGREVGRFDGDEIYGVDGRYLGGIKNDKLITKLDKKSRMRNAFTSCQSASYVPSVNRVGSVLPAGYEDFPEPETFP